MRLFEDSSRNPSSHARRSAKLRRTFRTRKFALPSEASAESDTSFRFLLTCFVNFAAMCQLCGIDLVQSGVSGDIPVTVIAWAAPKISNRAMGEHVKSLHPKLRILRILNRNDSIGDSELVLCGRERLARCFHSMKVAIVFCFVLWESFKPLSSWRAVCSLDAQLHVLVPSHVPCLFLFLFLFACPSAPSLAMEHHLRWLRSLGHTAHSLQQRHEKTRSLQE